MRCSPSSRTNSLSSPWHCGQTAPAMKRLNEALATAVADAALQRQMQAVGVDLPAPESRAPGEVTRLIERGLKRDVPALKARGEYLD